MPSAPVDHAVSVGADLTTLAPVLRPGAAWRVLGRNGDDAVFGHLPGVDSLQPIPRDLERGSRLRSALSGAMPWALVGLATPHSVLAVASAGLPSGLFFHWLSDSPHQLTIGLDPRSVMETVQVGGTLNPRFLLGFLRGDVDVTDTAIAQVTRVPIGNYLRWSPGHAPVVSRWWDLEDPPPRRRRRGRVARENLLSAFDGAVKEMMRVPGPLAAELSGGLDSTFMVASMVRQTPPGRLVHAYCHVPVKAAVPHDRPNFVPDDSPWAQALVAAYPDGVALERISNLTGLTALDVAAAANCRSWWPVLNPGNQVWLEQLRGVARGAGAQMLFTGSSGNYSFSNTHRYALADALRAGRLPTASRSVTKAIRGGASWRTVYRLAHQPSWRGSVRTEGSFLLPRYLDVPRVQAASAERARFIQSLTGLTRPHLAALNPRLTEGLLVADPFLTPRVARAAAQIDPIEWWSGPWPRGLARTLGGGRVPDSVRFRRERGQQAADSWWHVRKDQERYLDEVRDVGTTPYLQEWVDHGRLSAVVTQWPWGLDGPGPSPYELNSVNRLLSLARFVRYLDSELRSESCAV